MPTPNDFQLQAQIAAAFGALFDYVLAIEQGADEAGAPVFSYLLTPKQKDSIDRICFSHGWPQINCLGILIDIDVIRHPLATRRAKNNITDDEIREIITRAFSPNSLIRANRDRGQQALILNNQRKVKIGGTAWYAVSVLQIRKDGPRTYLAPITCYHANEAKIRAIVR